MKKWYESLFENYGKKYDNESFTKGTIGECDFIEKEIDYDKSLKIIDIGCGTGRHSIELTKRGYNIIGIDLSDSQLKQAKEKAKAQNLEIEFQKHDARKLPFKDDFDLAIMLCEGGFCLMETDDGVELISTPDGRYIQIEVLFKAQVDHDSPILYDLTVNVKIDFTEVDVDIKPGSCPNPINLKDKGVLPIAICGNEDFDVTTINPKSIVLTREGYEGVSVTAYHWAYEDVATPYLGEEECGCHDLNGDGYLDLTMKFKAKEVIKTLNLTEEIGNTIPLIIMGNLSDENGSISIMGQDCIWILANFGKTRDNTYLRTGFIYQLINKIFEQFPLLRLLQGYLFY